MLDRVSNAVKMEFSKLSQERGRPQLTIRLFKSLDGGPSNILKVRLNLRTPKPNAEDPWNTEAGKKQGTYAPHQGSAKLEPLPLESYFNMLHKRLGES